MNPFNKIANATESGATGGANCWFCDGSDRFIKDTIQPWAINAGTGLPNGVGLD